MSRSEGMSELETAVSDTGWFTKLCEKAAAGEFELKTAPNHELLPWFVMKDRLNGTVNLYFQAAPEYVWDIAKSMYRGGRAQHVLDVPKLRQVPNLFGYYWTGSKRKPATLVHWRVNMYVEAAV